MKTIWKFPLRLTRDQIVSIPKGAKFLSVGNQLETICLWMEVDPIEEFESWDITIIETGGNLDTELLPKLPYLGTVHLSNSEYIFHVYGSN